MTRHTKRLAALASVIVTLLAALLVVPAAAALASTAGSGPAGGGPPGPITIACPPLLHGKHVKFKVLRLRKHPHGKPARVLINCSRLPFPPGCQLRPRPLVFDVASGSSTLTEVSGPTLAPAEEFFYAGGIYTIMTVNPGADSFTVFHNNFLFVNSGPAITNGHGILLCSPPKSLN